MNKIFSRKAAEATLIALMVVAVLVVIRLGMTAVFAQPAPQPEVSYTLFVTAAEANVIGGALAKLPYESVAALLGKLQKQITEQEQAARDVKPKADGAPEPKK